MSSHNHDEEIMKRFGARTAQKLQKKADDAADEALRNVIRDTDISGLSREDAKRKLRDAIDSLDLDE